MNQVLVIEDEPAIAESVVYALKKAGFAAHSVDRILDARSVLCAAEAGQVLAPDLLILDLMLPDGSGFDLLDELAGFSTRPAVIVLSSREAEADRIRALESGADDYVTKPFSPREVVARARAVLRRGPLASAPQLLKISASTRRVVVCGNNVELTKVEFDLLSLFAEDAEKAYSRAEIINRVWGPGFALSDRTIDSHIKALRRKLFEAGGRSEWIETVRGVGYRLNDEAGAQFT